MSNKRTREQTKWNRKLKGQKTESHLKSWEKWSRCVHSRGAGMHTLEEMLLVMTKELRWQVCFFPSNPPSGRLDDSLISAKFLCVIYLFFHLIFSHLSYFHSITHCLSVSARPLSTLLTAPFSPCPPTRLRRRRHPCTPYSLSTGELIAPAASPPLLSQRGVSRWPTVREIRWVQGNKKWGKEEKCVLGEKMHRRHFRHVV